ncbi:MAG TPA: metallophosphoesterase [Chitinispirillaceae bacterium]|nr:metallophosphoesterase [Chitinispirillaceae bacterium]
MHTKFKFSIHAFVLVILLTLHVNAEIPDFYFVQITDTHWGDGDNLQRTNAAINAINSLPIQIEFVIHTGDMTSRKIEDQNLIDSGLTIMKTCKFPVYYVPGNNDITEQNFKQQAALYVKNFGDINHKIDKENISIITLFNIELKDSSGKVIYDPVSTLDSLLKIKTPAHPALLFQHCPTTDDFYANTFHPGWSVEKSTLFKKLCKKYNVQDIFTGHFHRDELHWIDQIPLFVSAPISGAWGRQSSFRVYHYQNGKISYFTYYL